MCENCNEIGARLSAQLPPCLRPFRANPASRNCNRLQEPVPTMAHHSCISLHSSCCKFLLRSSKKSAACAPITSRQPLWLAAALFAICCTIIPTTFATKLPLEFVEHEPHTPTDPAFQVFYQTGNSEEDLPICSPHSVCNKVDTYDNPWIERQCRCPNDQVCSVSLDTNDGHTVTDKTRQFKTCEPVKKLPKCRFFRDVTWTFINYPDNSTQQIMHCTCPKNSVAYIIKRQAYQADTGVGYQYSFACSPQSRLRCNRKEPCRLFTVKKRAEVDEVNTNTLCGCPHGHRCPRRHTDVGVIPGKTYTEDLIRTYSGYCMSYDTHTASDW